MPSARISSWSRPSRSPVAWRMPALARILVIGLVVRDPAVWTYDLANAGILQATGDRDGLDQELILALGIRSRVLLHSLISIFSSTKPPSPMWLSARSELST
jgi:hypothetical protein